eukprot:12761668-Alexandrium_andersonii.AAC.1
MPELKARVWSRPPPAQPHRSAPTRTGAQPSPKPNPMQHGMAPLKQAKAPNHAGAKATAGDGCLPRK